MLEPLALLPLGLSTSSIGQAKVCPRLYMKIIVGIVSRGNDINYKLARFISELSKDRTKDFTFLIQDSPYSAQEGQEKLFKQLENIEFDYAFITDTDVAVELEALDKMIEVKKDVVIGPVWHYDISTRDIHLNIHYSGGEQLGIDSRVYFPKSKGVDKIISSSFGCMLIAKRVFDIFKEKGLPYTRDGSDKLSDNILFRRFKDLRIECWVRWDIKTEHFKVVSLSTDVIDRLLQRGIIDKYTRSQE